jgi:hypothetical protein
MEDDRQRVGFVFRLETASCASLLSLGWTDVPVLRRGHLNELGGEGIGGSRGGRKGGVGKSLKRRMVEQMRRVGELAEFLDGFWRVLGTTRTIPTSRNNSAHADPRPARTKRPDGNSRDEQNSQTQPHACKHRQEELLVTRTEQSEDHPLLAVLLSPNGERIRASLGREEVG